MTNVTRRDGYFGSIQTPQTELIYKPKRGAAFPLPEGFIDSPLQFGVPIYMKYKMNFVQRSVYDVFSFVRDLGGLVGGLNGFFIVFLTLLQF